MNGNVAFLERLLQKAILPNRDEILAIMLTERLPLVVFEPSERFTQILARIGWDEKPVFGVPYEVGRILCSPLGKGVQAWVGPATLVKPKFLAIAESQVIPIESGPEGFAFPDAYLNYLRPN